MSWRPSNSPRSFSPSPRDPRDKPSAISKSTLILIGAAVIVGLIVVGSLIAFSIARSSGGPAPVAQTTASAPAASATSAATVAPAVTVAATAPAIARGRGTPTPAPTIGPADAGPLQNTGDAEAGRALFTTMPTEALLAGAVACATCHNVDPGSGTLVGPSLSGVATRAETRVQVLSAAQYLRTSILAPNSYVVEGFTPGTMTQTFGKALTPAQVEDLVAYLLTLK
jgi:mono/diheme cytochrome c family protein